MRPTSALMGLALFVAPPAAAQQPLTFTDGWRHVFGEGPLDLGVGMLAFATEARDSLPLFAAPHDSRAIGFVTVFSDSIGGLHYTIGWPAALSTNLVEVGYEIAGLPFDSLTDDGWARVIPGFAGDEAARAWAPPGAGRTVTRWTDHLLQYDLFFRPEVAPAFFDAPNGRAVTFEVGRDAGDYILHPLEGRGSWLKVRAVAPADSCDEPQTPRTAELWIRAFGDDGRPRVWYYTRGC